MKDNSTVDAQIPEEQSFGTSTVWYRQPRRADTINGTCPDPFGRVPFRTLSRNMRSLDATRAAFRQHSRARPSCRSNTDTVYACCRPVCSQAWRNHRRTHTAV